MYFTVLNMPRGPGRKRPATRPAGPGPGTSRGLSDRPLTAAEIQRLLAEDSDAEPESDVDSSDSDDEPERIIAVTDTGDDVTAAPEVAAPEVAAPSDDSSEEDEGAPQTAADFVRVEQRSQQFQARTGRMWTTEPPNHRVRAAEANIMRGTPGPKGAARDVTSPTEAMDLFLPSSLLDKIVRHTNEETERVASKTGQRQAPVTRQELVAFIGLLLLRGCESDRRCDIQDLFYGPFSRPFYRATMPVNRFRHIMRCIRFDDKATRQERRKSDNFAAIREVFVQFNALLLDYFVPSDCVTVDETLRPFRGRCSFVTYIPNKPARYGLLIRDMADARTRYMMKMLPYAGKAEEPEPELHVTGATNIVKHLVAPLKGSGRNVTADRFYSGVELCEDLLKDKLTYVGTIMASRRHLPDDAKKTDGRTEKSTNFYWSDGVMLASYAKKKGKNVLIASTQHVEPLVATGHQSKAKPEVMLFYNATKGGIDTIDQMLDIYSCRAPTKRWPMVIFFAMLDVAALNSWVVLTAKPSPFGDGRHGGRRAFLRELGLALIKPLIQCRPTDGMVSKTRSAVETVLKIKMSSSAVVPPSSTETRARCHMCVAALQGCGYKQGRHQKVNKVKMRCSQCRRAACTKHSTSAGILCGDCTGQQYEPGHE